MPNGLQRMEESGSLSRKRQIWDLRWTTIGLFVHRRTSWHTHTQVDNLKQLKQPPFTKQRKFGHDQFIIQWSEPSGARCFDLFFMMFNFWKSQIDLDILCGASLLTILLRVKRLDWGLNLFKPPRWWGAQRREVDNPTSIKSRSTSHQTAAQGANMSHPTLLRKCTGYGIQPQRSSWIHKKHKSRRIDLGQSCMTFWSPTEWGEKFLVEIFSRNF